MCRKCEIFRAYCTAAILSFGRHAASLPCDMRLPSSCPTHVTTETPPAAAAASAASAGNEILQKKCMCLRLFAFVDKARVVMRS